MYTQFQFCQLCRINHKKKRKHIYSIRHQNVVNNILEKYLRKVTEARSTLKSPQIHNAQFERGAKFWCHFCVEEELKHMELDTCTVKYGGLIEHIASYEHKRKMYNFFYENKVDETKRHPDLFHMPEEDLKKFKEKVAICAKEYDSGNREELEKSAEKIRQTEALRNQVVQSHHFSMLKPQTIENASSQRMNIPNYISPGTIIEKKATMLAKGDGLTFIGSHIYNRNEGNVHSGAPPPWLLSSEEETTSGEIGPTIDSYKAHLEREKKKKLPANRVGAKFDHQQSTDQAWLPSFGRVWSKGGRQQSKKYFQRISSTTKKSSTVSNFTASSDRDASSFSVYSSENDIQNRVESKMNGDISVFQSNAGENEHSFQNGVRTDNPQVHSNSTFPFHHQSGSEVDTNFSVVPRNNVKPYVKKHRPESTASGYTQTQGQAQYEHRGMNQLQPQSFGGNLNMNHLNQSGSYLNHSMNPSVQPVMNESTYSVNQWSQSTSYSAQPASQSTQTASLTHSRTAKPYVRKRKSEDIGSTEMNSMGHIPVIPTPILEAKAPPSTSRWK